MVQCRAARFVTWPTGREHTCSVGEMFQHLNWPCLEDKHKDAWLDMMYIIASQNVAIYKQTDLCHTWNNHSICISRFSLSLLVRLNKDNNGFPSYNIIWLKLADTAYSFEFLCWNIQGYCLLYEILIYETCK